MERALAKNRLLEDKLLRRWGISAHLMGWYLASVGKQIISGKSSIFDFVGSLSSGPLFHPPSQYCQYFFLWFLSIDSFLQSLTDTIVSPPPLPANRVDFGLFFIIFPALPTPLLLFSRLAYVPNPQMFLNVDFSFYWGFIFDNFSYLTNPPPPQHCHDSSNGEPSGGLQWTEEPNSKSDAAACCGQVGG